MTADPQNVSWPLGQGLVGCGGAAVVFGSFGVAADVVDVGGVAVRLGRQRRGPQAVSGGRRGCFLGHVLRVLGLLNIAGGGM